MSLLVFPSILVVFKISEIDLVKITKSNINWNLFYFDQVTRIRKKILVISIFKFSSSFTSNGLAIATITPFLMSINDRNYSIELILTIAGIIVGFRWIADIVFGVLFGTLSDKFGRKINIISSSSLMIMTILILISGLNFYISVVFLVLMFFLSVSLDTSLEASLGEISPEKEKSNIVSRYSTWQDLGAALGPILGYIIASYYGINYGYILSIVLIFICLNLYIKNFRDE